MIIKLRYQKKLMAGWGLRPLCWSFDLLSRVLQNIVGVRADKKCKKKHTTIAYRYIVHSVRTLNRSAFAPCRNRTNDLEEMCDLLKAVASEPI